MLKWVEIPNHNIFRELCILTILDGREYLQLSQSPHLLEERIVAYIENKTDHLHLVIIDEIQKLPMLRRASADKYISECTVYFYRK